MTLHRPRILLCFIFLATCGLVVATPTMTNNSIPQPVARYMFTTEQCIDGIFADTPQSNAPRKTSFSRNQESTKCSKGIGVESLSNLELPGSSSISPVSMASNSTKQIIDRIGQSNDGVSFEFWLKSFGEDRNSSSSIFTIGSQESSTGNDSNSGRSVCDQGHFDLQLAEVDSKFQITFRSSESFFYPCFRSPLLSFPVSSNKLIHVVIALQNGHQQVFFNGQGETFAAEQFSNNLDQWTDESSMQFFSHFRSTTGVQNDPWKGIICQFSIYDRVISREEVQHSLQEGLSGGLPYSIPYPVVLNEDAERVPGSHPPEWYASPLMIASKSQHEVDDIQKITLRSGTVEEEVHELLSSANLGQPDSVPKESFSSSPQLFYITRLPSKGSLYQISGQFFMRIQQQFNEEPVSIFIEDPTSLIFLPAYNEFSEIPAAKYTDISYCVTNHVIFDPFQCESSVISIFVKPVNDPPIAFTSPHMLSTTEGLDWESLPSIEIGGNEVDQRDSISAIQITQPPRWGNLLLRVTEFRDDGLAHGSILSEATTSELKLRSQNSKSIHVKYLLDRSNTSVPQQPIPGNEASDHFSFRVLDQHGAWSSEKSVCITIVSALQASFGQAPFQLSSGDNITTLLHGNDASGYQRPLVFFFETVPSHSTGWLVHSMTGKQVAAGSIIETDGHGSSAAIAFVPNSNSRNATQSATTGNFTFRAAALEDGTITSASLIVTHSLEGPCVSVPTLELSTSTESLSLESFSLSSSRETGCGVSVYDLPRFAAACPTVAEINGIKVTASDFHIHPVFVTLLPGNGYVTFNDEFWHHAKAIRGRRNMATEEIQFEAHPDDLQDILNGLLFRSQTIGDSLLTLSMEYGNCFELLTTNSTASDSPCQRLNLTIPVHVAEGEQDDIYEPVYASLPHQVWISWFAYPILYAVYAIVADLLNISSPKAALGSAFKWLFGSIIRVFVAIVARLKAIIWRSKRDPNKRRQ